MEFYFSTVALLAPLLVVVVAAYSRDFVSSVKTQNVHFTRAWAGILASFFTVIPFYFCEFLSVMALFLIAKDEPVQTWVADVTLFALFVLAGSTLVAFWRQITRIPGVTHQGPRQSE